MLARFPLCVMCKAKGIYRPTDEIDHVVPLNRGGPDTEDNLQGLCTPCHEAKSTAEQGWMVSNHPDWLQPSLIPLTIVTGPPCAGKSTLVRMHASAHDLVIDLDDIMLALDPAYQPWTGDKSRLDEAIRIRNRQLGQLAHASPWPRAWFVVSAPTAEERQWWLGKLGGKLRHLHPGVEECQRRALARHTPGAVEGVAEWERRSRLPWTPHRSKVPVDAEGWPVGMVNGNG